MTPVEKLIEERKREEGYFQNDEDKPEPRPPQRMGMRGIAVIPSAPFSPWFSQKFKPLQSVGTEAPKSEKKSETRPPWVYVAWLIVSIPPPIINFVKLPFGDFSYIVGAFQCFLILYWIIRLKESLK